MTDIELLTEQMLKCQREINQVKAITARTLNLIEKLTVSRETPKVSRETDQTKLEGM